MTAIPYRPGPVPQMDGSYYQQSNCVCAVTAELIDRVTVGRLRYSGAQIRNASGDTSGGLTYTTAAATAKAKSGGAVILDVRYGLTRGEYQSLSAGGYPMGTSILARVTRYTSRRTNTFTGGHTVYVQQWRWALAGTCACEKGQSSAHGEYLVEDPGTTATGYLWWSADLLYRAAEARTNGSGINVLIGRDTEGTTRTGRAAGNVRSATATSSTDKGNIVVGTSYTVVNTQNGGVWSLPDGVGGSGWHKIKWGTGYAYVAGGLLR